MNLSLILPIRNGAGFVDSSLKAIQEMVRPEDEILIIDDGSTDGTAEKLFKYSNSDSRFRVIPSGGIGLVGSLNLGLSIASNKYAARFDVDDRYEIERLSVQREALFSNPVAVFSDYECWNSTFTRSLRLHLRVHIFR